MTNLHEELMTAGPYDYSAVIYWAPDPQYDGSWSAARLELVRSWRHPDDDVTLRPTDSFWMIPGCCPGWMMFYGDGVPAGLLNR